MSAKTAPDRALNPVSVPPGFRRPSQRPNSRNEIIPANSRTTTRTIWKVVIDSLNLRMTVVAERKQGVSTTPQQEVFNVADHPLPSGVAPSCPKSFLRRLRPASTALAQSPGAL